MVRRGLGALAVLAALLLLLPAGPARADVGQVRGTQVYDPATGVAQMSGDLVGDWYTLTFDVSGYQPSGTLQADGTEVFVGCWDVDGGEGFEGAGGQLTFKDRMGSCGQTVATYSGHIDL